MRVSGHPWVASAPTPLHSRAGVPGLEHDSSSAETITLPLLTLQDERLSSLVSGGMQWIMIESDAQNFHICFCLA